MREHIGFSLTSQGAQLATVFVSDSALPLFVGAMLGPAAILPLTIGQKFPAAVGQLTTTSAQVFYSTAAVHAHSRDGVRDFLELGSRWMALLAVGAADLRGHEVAHYYVVSRF